VACLADFGIDAGVVDLAAAVLRQMSVWYHHAAADGGELISAWRARALPWWGRQVETRAGDEMLRGRAVDVDESGALILELPGGRMVPLHAGEVREVRGGPPAR
jgi:biotin-(acetyl-CoA carboxylase) ligase